MAKTTRLLAGILFVFGLFIFFGTIGSMDYDADRNQIPDEAGNTKRMAAGILMMVPFGFCITNHTKVDKSMKEKDFEKEVKEFLKEKGCWVLKTWSNGVQRKGIPDLLVCCNGYFLGIELKQEHGSATALQLYNIRHIRNASGIGIVLYPNQFQMFQALIGQLMNDFNKQSQRDWFLKQTSFDKKYKRKGKEDESV